MVLVSAGVYQLVKQYGTDKAAGASGYPYRQIKKPVAGTVLVGIGATAIRSADWSVVTTTGVVTFAADQTKSITAITTGGAGRHHRRLIAWPGLRPERAHQRRRRHDPDQQPAGADHHRRRDDDHRRHQFSAPTRPTPAAALSIPGRRLARQ